MMNNVRTIVLTTTVVANLLPINEAVFEHIKVGVSLKHGRMPDCMVPEHQLTYNLFVDYFQSMGPCITPEGSQIYTFRNRDDADKVNSYAAFNSVCLKLPKICHLLKGPRNGRLFTEVGQHMASNLQNNVNALYNWLTGQSSTSRGESTSRFDTVSSHHLTSTSSHSHDCQYGPCADKGVELCEVIEDVAFPVVGRSAITNVSVNIMQNYPERVQPIFYRKCKDYKPNVVYGRCVQEYLPVSVYVASQYTDSVLQQDFVMVESGCKVVADISYQVWSQRIKGSPHIFHSARNTESQWVSHTEETQPQVNDTKPEQEAYQSESSVSLETDSGRYPPAMVQSRRISDRQLHLRG